MSREHRKAKRKARVRAERLNPTPPVVIPEKAARDPATRWLNLSARRTPVLSLRPVGAAIPVDLDSPDAPVALHLAAAARGPVPTD